MEKNIKIILLFDIFGGLLTEKQADAIDFYYNNDLSLGEIAENIGITRQGVRDAIKRAEEILFDAEEKTGLCAKLSLLESTIEKVKQNLTEIDYYNKQTIYNKDIDDRVIMSLDLIAKTEEGEENGI